MTGDLHSTDRPRILVIDPDEADRNIVVWTLRAVGFSVDEACSASALGGDLRGVDLIIADAALPGLRPVAAPLVLMTSNLSGKLRALARALDAAAVIHRPVYIDELRGAVARALGPGPRQPTRSVPERTPRVPLLGGP